MLKRVFLPVIISFLIITIQAQVTDIGKLKFNDTKGVIHTSNLPSVANGIQAGSITSINKYRFDSVQTEKKYQGTQKSPGLAFLFSLFVPGTGQLYAHRFDVGKYYMISEVALWLGFTSFTIYGNWLIKDAHKFAQIHAGINQNGKDDNFFVNISNYNNMYEFNDNQLRNGRYDQLYDPANGYYFYWDNVANRQTYRTDQLAGDRVITDRLFFVGAILINHVISAISAIVLTNSYNDQLRGTNGGFAMNADVVRTGNRINGLQLKITKWF